MTGDDQNKRKITRHTKKLLIENLNLEEKTEMVPLELNIQIWQNFVQRKNWVLHEKLNLVPSNSDFALWCSETEPQWTSELIRPSHTTSNAESDSTVV